MPAIVHIVNAQLYTIIGPDQQLYAQLSRLGESYSTRKVPGSDSPSWEEQLSFSDVGMIDVYIYSTSMYSSTPEVIAKAVVSPIELTNLGSSKLHSISLVDPHGMAIGSLSLRLVVSDNDSDDLKKDQSNAPSYDIATRGDAQKGEFAPPSYSIVETETIDYTSYTPVIDPYRSYLDLPESYYALYPPQEKSAKNPTTNRVDLRLAVFAMDYLGTKNADLKVNCLTHLDYKLIANPDHRQEGDDAYLVNSEYGPFPPFINDPSIIAERNLTNTYVAPFSRRGYSQQLLDYLPHLRLGAPRSIVLHFATRKLPPDTPRKSLGLEFLTIDVLVGFTIVYTRKTVLEYGDPDKFPHTTRFICDIHEDNVISQMEVVSYKDFGVIIGVKLFQSGRNSQSFFYGSMDGSKARYGQGLVTVKSSGASIIQQASSFHGTSSDRSGLVYINAYLNKHGDFMAILPFAAPVIRADDIDLSLAGTVRAPKSSVELTSMETPTAASSTTTTITRRNDDDDVPFVRARDIRESPETKGMEQLRGYMFPMLSNCAIYLIVTILCFLYGLDLYNRTKVDPTCIPYNTDALIHLAACIIQGALLLVLIGVGVVLLASYYFDWFEDYVKTSRHIISFSHLVITAILAIVGAVGMAKIVMLPNACSTSAEFVFLVGNYGLHFVHVIGISVFLAVTKLAKKRPWMLSFLFHYLCLVVAVIGVFVVASDQDTKRRRRNRGYSLRSIKSYLLRKQ